MNLFAVTGKPILHSKSPRIHNSALTAAEIEGRYCRLAAESPEEAIEVSRELRLLGLNVTAPFKESMARLVDILDDLAREVGSVNTVCFGERTRGFNTDVYGIARAFSANGISLQGKRVLILGAGGAARAAIVAFQGAGAEVSVANRSEERVAPLQEEFGVASCSLAPTEIASALAKVDIVFNTTATTERIIPDEAFRPGLIVMDAHYGGDTALLVDARMKGATVIDGSEWLIHQGLEAFRKFTSVEPNEAAFRSGMNAPLSSGRGIALVGMMGSGKSTVAKLLAAQRGIRLVDLDAQIVEQAGMSIPQIFSEQGEAYFRELEHQALAQVVASGPSILATGGGVVLSPKNRALLREFGVTAWLWASTADTFDRIRGCSDRPLLSTPDPESRFTSLLESRIPLYAEVADLIVPTGKKQPQTIAERINYEIDQIWRP